jgi:hypothetical protein
MDINVGLTLRNLIGNLEKGQYRDGWLLRIIFHRIRHKAAQLRLEAGNHSRIRLRGGSLSQVIYLQQGWNNRKAL